MRKADMLENPERSTFFRTDKEYRKFLDDKVFSLSLYRDHGHRDTPPLFYGSFNGGGENPPMETRELKIPKIPDGTAAPVIDGDLDDPVWARGASANQFRELGNRNPVKQQTDARLLYDKKNLYISIFCHDDKPKEIKDDVTERDGNVFTDDCIEIFLSTFPNAKQNFWHLALNPANARWDGIVAVTGQDMDWQSAARIVDNGWTAEIIIPFKSLGFKEVPTGKTWKANLARCERPHGENSAWNACHSGFLEPYSFGDWTFVP